MPKIAFIGAGSTVFAKNLLGDILSFPELSSATISLHDIDEERLRTSEVVARRVAATLEARPAIEATADRRRALDGADYVIAMFQIGGYRPSTVIDFEIPKRYGLRQTIADTLGIGGIMRGLRTIPVLLDVCADMEAVCPDAHLLNYVNPMAMNCWALSRATSIRTIGLCHSVQGTAEQLARESLTPRALIRSSFSPRTRSSPAASWVWMSKLMMRGRTTPPETVAGTWWWLSTRLICCDCTPNW